MTRGAFIVLEGLDRSGKSTQVGLLEKRLRAEGRDVRVMRFPGRFFPSSFPSFCLMVGEGEVGTVAGGLVEVGRV